eukprot:6005943-Prymnesium_polylepis.1
MSLGSGTADAWLATSDCIASALTDSSHASACVCIRREARVWPMADVVAKGGIGRLGSPVAFLKRETRRNT